MEPKDLRIVVNIPFCARACTYCDYPVCDKSASGLRSAYMAALNEELDTALDSFEGYLVRSIYVTGGTPTTVDPRQLADFILRIKAAAQCASDLEVTIDTNPGAVGVDALSQFLRAGVTRFDLGLCTLHPLEFQTLVRPYGWNDVHMTQMLFEFASFKNYSFDVLYGIPGQTPGTLRDTIEEALEIVPSPTHIALMPLRPVPGTPFYRCFVEGANDTGIITHGRSLPTDDERVALYQRGCEVLEKAGFERYTASHFAKPGFRCRHAELSCEDTDVLGFGLAAQTHMDGLLSTTTADLQRYLDAHGNPETLTAQAVLLDEPSRQARYAAAALLAEGGLTQAGFEGRFGHGIEGALAHSLEALEGRGLLTLARDAGGAVAGAKLTERGAALPASVFEQL